MSSRITLLAIVLLVTGCTVELSAPLADDHPASACAAEATFSAPISALQADAAATTQPATQPDAMPGMDHSHHHHGS